MYDRLEPVEQVVFTVRILQRQAGRQTGTDRQMLTQTRETETDRQTERQRDRETDRVSLGQRERQTEIRGVTRGTGKPMLISTSDS